MSPRGSRVSLPCVNAVSPANARTSGGRVVVVVVVVVDDEEPVVAAAVVVGCLAVDAALATLVLGGWVSGVVDVGSAETPEHAVRVTRPPKMRFRSHIPEC